MAGASSALQSKREMGKATRDAFGRALEALGEAHPEVIVVDADVSNSTRTEWFGKKYPARFFNIGIAESNLVGIAAGLASSGKTSVIASFAAFIMCNAYDQLRMSVAYPGLNVKVVGSHAGISIGEDGASQMGIEDVALAASLPGFTVIVPADDLSTQAATKAMIEQNGPVYLRVGRPDVPRVYSAPRPRLQWAKLICCATGPTSPSSPTASWSHRHSTQPNTWPARGSRRACSICIRSSRSTARPSRPRREKRARSSSPRSTWPTAVWEAAVAMAVAEVHPVPIRFVNLGDQFGESGAPEALLEKYGLTAAHVVAAARDAVAAKKS